MRLERHYGLGFGSLREPQEFFSSLLVKSPRLVGVLELITNSESNADSQPSSSVWVGRLQTVFWLTFFFQPVFTGVPSYAYRYLPNEQFDESIHIALSSHEVEDDAGRSAEIVDKWQHNKSGVTYTRSSFTDHRWRESRRMAVVLFAYGLIGCSFFGWVRWIQKRISFYDAFGRAVLLNLGIATMTWLVVALL